MTHYHNAGTLLVLSSVKQGATGRSYCKQIVPIMFSNDSELIGETGWYVICRSLRNVGHLGVCCLSTLGVHTLREVCTQARRPNSLFLSRFYTLHSTVVVMLFIAPVFLGENAAE